MKAADEQTAAARWQQVRGLFLAALERPADEWDAFLASACADDVALRDEVASLLAAHKEAEGSYLEALDAEQASILLHEDEAPMPQHIGPYRIVEELGLGGMGRVYLAERADGQFEQQVALKLIKRGMDSGAVLRRFLAERQILARLQHPNVARLLDGGISDDGRPYFAMEHVDGRPITEYCDENRLSIEQRLRLFESVGEAVEYAHHNLIVHRDLKPSNILVTDEGQVKLLDFGIGKVLGGETDEQAQTLTEAGFRAMTPEYAAPEQVRGEAVTTATDVYSLGVVLYELLVGRRPYTFARRTPEEMARVISETEPERPSTAISQVGERQDAEETISQRCATKASVLRRRLSGDLDTVVLKTLRKEPERRYASAEAFIEDVKRHLAGLPVTARPDTAGYRLRKFVGRHKVGVLAAALVVLSLAGGLAASLWQARIAAQQRDTARQEAAKATQVTDFLVRAFEVADPRETGARTLTAREVLDRGSARIEAELADQPEIQAALHGVVGRVYQSMGLWDEARPFLERSLTTRQALFGPEHPDVAASLVNMANLLRLLGEYEAAESLYGEALTMLRRLYGEEHPLVATTLDHLGLLLHFSGQFDRVALLHAEALAMRRKLLGAEHLDVASSLNNLAGALNSQEKFEEAEALYREALAMRRKLLGPEHPDVAVTLNNLARNLRVQGDLDTAESLYRQAIAIWRKHYGDAHPHVARGIGNLAALLRARGDLDTAEPLYREALELSRRMLGDAHPDQAIRLNNLGRLLHDKGDLAAAEASFQEAILLWQRLLGAEHPHVPIGLNNLAAVLHDKGDLAAAESRYRESLALFRKTRPPGSSRIGTALLGLGRVLVERNRPHDAEPVLREALDNRRASYGDTDARTLEVKVALAACLTARRSYDEAETLLLESLAALADTDAEARQQARKALVDLYTAWGKPEEASKYRAASAPTAPPP